MAAGATTQGSRLPDAVLGEPGPGWEAWEGDRPGTVLAAPGSYMKVTSDGPAISWYIVDPTGRPGTLIDGGNHRVVEHEDRTITVSPSILYPDGWHGFLERGVWREV